MNDLPRVRLLDLQPIYHQGQRMWLLRDPLELDRRQLILPPLLAHMLRYCDGKHTPEQIRERLSADAGFDVPLEAVVDALTELDRAYLLDNARSAATQQAHLAAYREQPHRPPALAGLSYPEDEAALVRLLDAYANGDAAPLAETVARGIVSPHIDYQRGGPVYARTWRQAAAAVLDAEMVVVLGTDHNGSPGSITLTRQAYATPFGVLPTDTAVVDALATAIGETTAYAEELHHRGEHSIELSAVWLHDVFRRAGRPPCPVVPVLVGSFHHFLSNGSRPADDAQIEAFLEALRAVSVGRRVIVVGAVDLAHVGPAFGDAFSMDGSRRAALRAEDEALMAAIGQGDAEGFYDRIAAVGDRNRICGFAPLYLLLRFLGPATGHRVSYQQCPADEPDTSLVSICGMLLE